MAQDEIKRLKRSGDDYYAVLGVDKDAGDDVIKKAYRKLALKLHPDKCSEPGAEEAFKKLSEAFSTLSDPQKRRIFDQCGAEGLRGGGGGGGGGMDINPEDIFQAFFGGMQPGGATFMRGGQSGMHFSSGGGQQGVFHFSTSSMGPGGGFQTFNIGPGMRAGPQIRQRQRPQPEEEEAPMETPAWIKSLQAVAGGLGPLLPLVAVALIGLGMILMGAVLQFFIQRMMILLPILYLTEGRVKIALIGGVVVLGLLGLC